MSEVKAQINVEVPDWQIGQEVSLYFPDTMMIKGTCEKQDNIKSKVVTALTELVDQIDPECIVDSSNDKHGYISDYEKGLLDAFNIMMKHLGEYIDGNIKL